MDKLLLLSLLSLALVVVAVAGAWPSFFSRRAGIARLAHMGDPFAVGVFLGAGLIHMLPEAVHGFTAQGVQYPWAFMLAGAVMLLLGWTEACSHPPHGHGHDHQHTQGNGHAHKVSPLVATAALAFHSVLAGLALGAGQTDAAIFVIFIALIAHKGAAAFALGRLLTGSSLSRSAALILMAIFILALPVGVAFGLLANETMHSSSLVTPVILALGAGTFLHFGTTHHHFDEEPEALHTGWPTIAGFALMALIAIVA